MLLPDFATLPRYPAGFLPAFLHPISVYLAKHRNTDKLKGWEGKKQDLSGCCQ
jgi:hypothetical protein